MSELITMCLSEYIDDAKEYRTFELANKAEDNDHLWVDSLSDEHIEIHSSDLNKDTFINEITNLVSDVDCIVTFDNERMIVSRKATDALYAIISL